jgi:hypothetical protein
MKKKSRKLSIKRETLQDLSDTPLAAVAGGVSNIATNCVGLCYTCLPENCLW